MNTKPAKRMTMDIFANADDFGVAVRQAQYLSNSTLVPKDYQRNEGNCLIAIDVANRIHANPLMVMQNLYIVNGKPSWSSQWIIAMINASKQFAGKLQFDFGTDAEDGGMSCTAWAEDWNGNRVYGPKITMNMARAEGWTSKNASKWKSMPEVMMRYRAASFFGRLNCPDMIMGLYSEEESQDAFGSADFGVDNDTGEILVPAEEPAAAPSDTALVTSADRHALFALAKTAWENTDERNNNLKAMVNEMGYKTTSEMTKADYDIVYKRISDIIEANKTETAIYNEVEDAVVVEVEPAEAEPEQE